MGELQLQIIVDRLKREFGLDAVTGNVGVAYRETITANADGEGRHISSAGGRGSYAYVKIHLSQGQPGTDYVFTNRTESALPDPIIQAVDQGIRDAATSGSVVGYPVDDISIDLFEVSFHETGASEDGFRTAGAMAFRDALRNAKPVMIEPIMWIETNVPKDLARDVVDNLARRGAELQSEDRRRSTRVTTARARMSQMLGYGVELRQQTAGRGTHSMRVDGYRRVER